MTSGNHYDFIVVGGGPAGVFFAYEMVQKNPDKRIALIEQGKRVENRQCPETKKGKCIKCQPFCNITCGFSGAGAFSDGKLSLYNKGDDDFYVGGNLHKYVGVDDTKKLIDYTDGIYLEFGATTKLEGVDDPEKITAIRKRAEIEGLDLINIPIRHLGTDKSHDLYKKIERYLIESGVEIMFETEVKDLVVSNNKIVGVELMFNIEIKDLLVSNNKIVGGEIDRHIQPFGPQTIYADKVVLAVGRVGANWLLDMCEKHKIKTTPGVIDIGVRYELPNEEMEEINTYLYEGKFIGKPKPFNDKVRTFCQNPSGFVTTEVYDDGLTLVNGHSCKDIKSDNTNLALLVSLNLQDVNPMKYLQNIAHNMNALADGNILVQRLHDIKSGKRTWNGELEYNSVQPTLKSAKPGDLSLAMPYRVLTNILEFIEQMEGVAPGFANPTNLLYGPEIKFYSNKVELSKTFETSVEGLYAIGDGCGLTRGLMMASASGVQLARNLCD